MIIQDLTANSDFSSNNNTVEENIDVITDELVLTGDCTERASKQWLLDYNSLNCPCERFGRLITIVPWRSDDYVQTLCKMCDEIVSVQVLLSQAKDLALVIGETEQSGFIYAKPWTFRSEPSPSAIDNVLLWD